jgi:hypothetical protein
LRTVKKISIQPLITESVHHQAQLITTTDPPNNKKDDFLGVRKNKSFSVTIFNS